MMNSINPDDFFANLEEATGSPPRAPVPEAGEPDVPARPLSTLRLSDLRGADSGPRLPMPPVDRLTEETASPDSPVLQVITDPTPAPFVRPAPSAAIERVGHPVPPSDDSGPFGMIPNFVSDRNLPDPTATTDLDELRRGAEDRRRSAEALLSEARAAEDDLRRIEGVRRTEAEAERVRAAAQVEAERVSALAEAEETRAATARERETAEREIAARRVAMAAEQQTLAEQRRAASESIEAQRQAAEAELGRRAAEAQAAINDQLSALAAERERAEQVRAVLATEQARVDEGRVRLEAQRREAEAEIERMRSEVPTVSADPEDLRGRIGQAEAEQAHYERSGIDLQRREIELAAATERATADAESAAATRMRAEEDLAIASDEHEKASAALALTSSEEDPGAAEAVNRAAADLDRARAALGTAQETEATERAAAELAESRRRTAGEARELAGTAVERERLRASLLSQRLAGLGVRDRPSAAPAAPISSSGATSHSPTAPYDPASVEVRLPARGRAPVSSARPLAEPAPTTPRPTLGPFVSAPTFGPTAPAHSAVPDESIDDLDTLLAPRDEKPTGPARPSPAASPRPDPTIPIRSSPTASVRPSPAAPARSSPTASVRPSPTERSARAVKPNLSQPIDEQPVSESPFLPGLVSDDTEVSHIPAGAGNLILYAAPPSIERFKPVETVVSVGVSVLIVCMIGLILLLAGPTLIDWISSLVRDPSGFLRFLDGLRPS